MTDVSVRVAWADDASAIATVQVQTWAEHYAQSLHEAAHLEHSPVAAAWHAALSQPGDARNRVLVALEGNRVVGFSVTIPSPDPDCDPIATGELVEFDVAPAHRNRGHGSRLLQATVDTMLADRFSTATCWITSDDDTRRQFLTAAGWASDGAHRELALSEASSTVKQVRLHTTIA